MSRFSSDSSVPQVPAESGEPDDTGSDEAIVPTDMNLLTGLEHLSGSRVGSLCLSLERNLA